MSRFRQRASFCLVLSLCATHLFSQSANPGPARPPVPLDVTIAMRDGVRLAADVFLPKPSGRWPTVLVRTPYNRKLPAARGSRYFLQRGYALVIEDVRGRFGSQGAFGLVLQEGPDGSDTINWIAAQPWSNGRVAMAGSSYLGIVQWWAALEQNPHLRAISPMVSGDDEYADRYYSEGGALKLGHRLLWLTENFGSIPSTDAPLDYSLRRLPLRTAGSVLRGPGFGLWTAALNHPSFDDYWKKQSVRQEINRINVPVLSLGGWFDNYVESDLDAFSRLAKLHKPVETWIGPWAHNPALRFATINFGPEADLALRSKQADWFDRWLGKTPPPEAAKSEANLHIFVMGVNHWREEHEWPLARTRYTPLYLASEGKANTSDGDGVLQWQLRRKSKADSFTYDPKNPVPTRGGTICCEPKIFPPGPLDQTSLETRPDVLVYTSPPLAEEIEVTGPVRMVLYVATSANDTDFTAKLVDVQPDGRPLLVSDGIQRLRYRLSLDKPVFVKRNQAYQISVDAGATSYVFGMRHRIRLEVSSSNFPRFDRNLNTPGPNADQAKLLKAHQTVFHEKGYPSAIILPVISHTGAPGAAPMRRRG